MFRAGNHPILADEMEVLMELRDQLALNGIDRFRSMKRTQDHIQCTCPFHKDGQERRPSCGITTNDIRQGDKLVRAGTVHCLACGYTGTLEETISRLFGYNDLGVFGTAWLKKNFLTVQYEERDSLDLDLSRGKKTGSDTIKYVSEEELDSYRYIHPYMYQRKLTDDVIEMFDVGYDDCFVLQSQDGKETMYKCVTFPVRDITGGTLFIARRSVDTKFFNYPAGVEKPVYGIYELSQIKPYPTEVYICESILDCLTLWTHNKYAVALNGLGTDSQFKQLSSMPTRKFIIATDSDNAGIRARKKIREKLSNKIITEIVLPYGRKDINECSYDEIENLEEVI